MTTNRVLTGIRPTGPLHLGHYVGALKNWLAIQNGQEHECFFLIADVQALTTHASRPELIKESVFEVLADWLAVGLDPTLPRTHFVVQSMVPARYELSTLLQMVTPNSWVTRNPTVKAEMESLKEEMVVGFATYPVDQAADILMVADIAQGAAGRILVPVGEDQLPHLELTREIARRFNKIYGCDLLPDCKGLVGDVGRLVGTDGNAKMSKSLGNAIYLSDPADTVAAKVNAMFTDPNKLRATDPGNTDHHVPFMYLRDLHPDKDKVASMEADYKAGRLGDMPVKRELITALNELLEPIRERRAALHSRTDLFDSVIHGTECARRLCEHVVGAMKEQMRLDYVGALPLGRIDAW